MKVLLAMKLHLVCKRTIIGILLTGATAMAGSSDKAIVESVRAMEKTLGVKIIEPGDLGAKGRPTEQSLGVYVGRVIEVSPDGTAIVWSDGTPLAKWLKPDSYRGEKTPFFTVESLNEGKQPVWVEAPEAAYRLGISAEGKVIVAMALPVEILPTSRWQLLAIDRRSGIVIHDLTRFVTQVDLGPRVEDISVSGPGTLVALGTSEHIQVLEIPSGKSVFSSLGCFPRLSPDGNRLAFVDKDKLWIHSFADGSKIQLLKGKRVKGLGGWSPDGRFVLAGAWTTELAFEKRKIIIDTTTGEYVVIGKLGEGDYGAYLVWASVKLLPQ
jgi:hypothetical protein